MKYLRVNIYGEKEENLFVISGETYKECEEKAYTYAVTEQVRIRSFQFLNEEEYQRISDEIRSKN